MTDTNPTASAMADIALATVIDLNAQIASLTARCSQLEVAGEWIACADRMPPICPLVLVWVVDADEPTDGWYELAYWPGPEYGWHTDFGVKRTRTDPITYWMPLPKSHPSARARGAVGEG